MNDELRALFEQDQADRQGELPANLWERDLDRRQRVGALIDAGALRTAADHLHAAFVFQHGDRLEHYWQAHELALRAVELDHGPPARWLAAASYDRWLMHQGQPQKFGTQYTVQDGRYVLYTVDPATPDTERARWDVPPLARALERAEAYNRELAASEQLHPQAQGASAQSPVLAQVDLGGMAVALVAIAGSEAPHAPEAMPAPTPLSSGVHPLPTYLPPGLNPRQLGEAYCAVDAAEQFQVVWIALEPPPDGMPLALAWNTDEGAPPALQVLTLAGRPAAYVERSWSAVSPERLPLLVLPGGPHTLWLVSGRLPLTDLAQVALTLPEQA